ncbi:MAG: hypothetical protein WD534_15185 [Phycisphaeraceae bacterium]
MIEETHLTADHRLVDGRALPTVLFDAQLHAVDLHRREFIHLAGDQQRERFDSPRGRQMCRLAGVRTCSHCLNLSLEPDPLAWSEGCCEHCRRPRRKDRLWGVPGDVMPARGRWT